MLLAALVAFAWGCSGTPDTGPSDGGCSGASCVDGGTAASTSTSGSGSSGSSGTSTGATSGSSSGSTGSGSSSGGNTGGIDVNLSVAANPNNVLSAVATVSSDMALTSVHVTYQAGSDAAQSTPEYPVSAASTVVPVLGLHAQTAYALQAVATLEDGGTATSAPVDFTTSALPAGVHVYSVADGGNPYPGYTLIARLPANAASGDDYITINDTSGAPVWYLDAKPGLVCDFQKQPDDTYTVAQDDVAHAVAGLPEAVATFEQYDVLGNHLHTWSAPPPAIATDCHELRIEPNGDALLLGLVEQTVDMSQYADGGKTNATVIGTVLDRVTPDGGLAFTWNSFDHLSLDTIAPFNSRTDAVVDATHANAIDVTDDGNYLLSLRDMSQVVKIDSTTGDVIWKLGGHYSDGGNAGDFTFVDDPLGGFSGQHGARELDGGDIILFDDGNEHTPPQSRAVEYKLDTTAHTATLVWSFEDSPPLYSFALGYVQRLPNGNTLVTFGTTNRIQEVDPNGNVVWDVRDLQPGFGLYRAYRMDSLY